MTNFEVPITDHPKLPDGVPLVASFHDMRNRLSYYYPMLRGIVGVHPPLTAFFPVEGDFDSYADIEYREVTRFLQDASLDTAFVRGDYSSGKLNEEDGSKITSHDPYDIEGVVIEMLRQLNRTGRYLGSRIAVREWIPHNIEVRYFIRDGNVLYRDTAGSGVHVDYPDEQARAAAEEFDTFAWSLDFIQHEDSGTWYAIDMGLDGLYHTGTEWVAMSEHLDPEQSPQRYADEMPEPSRFSFHK